MRTLFPIVPTVRDLLFKNLLRSPHCLGRVVVDGVVGPVSWSGKHSYQWIDVWLNQTEANYEWFLSARVEVYNHAVATTI